MSSNIEPVSLGKAKSAKPAASGSNRDNDGTASLAASSGGVSSRASLAAPGFGRTSTAGGGGDHRTSTAAATTFSSSSSNSASSSSTVLLQKKKTAAAAAAAANSVAEDDDDHRSFGHHDYSTTTTTTSNSFVRPKPPNMQSSSLAAAAAAASHSKQALQSRNSLNTGTNNSSKSVVRNSLVGHEDVSDAINMHDQGIKSKRTTSATGGSDEDCDEVDHDEESENKYGKQRGQGDTSSARKKSVPGLLSKLKKEEEEEVVKYYNLESFNQKIWIEDPTDTAESVHQLPKAMMKAGPIGRKASIGGPNPTSSSTPNDKTQPQKVKTKIIEMAKNMAAAEAADLVDPLGLNETLYREQRRAMMKGKTIPEVLIKPSLLIISKNFDPCVYLLKVQQDATFKQLEQGVDKLKVGIQQRNDVMKNLVKTHFAKFVSAKSTIDSFYFEMRNKNLISADDYGIAPFSKSLNGLTENALRLYGPMLDRRVKAEKIRLTLSVLEQWKFFFGLPATLQSQFKKHKYDVAVRDYKKGKSLMQSSFENTQSKSTSYMSQNNPIDIEVMNREKDNLLPQNHKKVFEKVWAEVERIMSTLRSKFMTQLENPNIPLDAQEKTMGYLLEMDPATDPVWFYLESQYKWILSQLLNAFKAHEARVDSLYKLSHGIQVDALNSSVNSNGSVVNVDTFDVGSRRTSGAGAAAVSPITIPNISSLDKSSVVNPSGPLTSTVFKKAVNSVHSKEFEKVFCKMDAEDLDVLIWKECLQTIRTICVILTKCIPDFWKVCRIFIENKLIKVKLTDQDQKKRRIDARKQETCQKMLQHIVNSASTLVSFILYLDVDIGQIRSMVLSTNKYFNKGSSMASEMDTANNNNSTQQPPSIVVNKNLTNLTATNISKSTSNNNIAKTSMDKISSSDQRRPSNLPTNIPINVPLPPVLPSPLPSEYSSFLVSHPLKTCFYISIIIQELVRSFIEVRAGLKEKYSSIQAVESVVERFGEAIENLKARTIEGVCASTLNESKEFYQYEDWCYEPETSYGLASANGSSDSSTITSVKLFYRFHKFIFKSLYHIGSTPALISSTPSDVASAEIDENLNNWMEWRATYNNNNSTGAAFLEDLEDKVVTAPKVAINTIEKIRSTCFESLYCFVDGLEWLAVHWRESAEMRNGVYDPEDFNGQSSVDDDVLYGSSGGGGGGNGHNPNTSGSLLKLENIKDILNKDDAIIGSWWEGSEAKRKRKYGQQNKKVFGLHADIGNLDNARGAFGLGLAAKGSASALDIRKVDTRILVIISNLAFVKNKMIPKLIEVFEAKFKLAVRATDGASLLEAVDFLDYLLFENYIRRKMKPIFILIKGGILTSGLDWNDLRIPQGVRSFCYEALLLLVMVHSQVSDISKSLITRVLSHILRHISVEILSSFRQVDKFSAGGMLQAQLEVQFLQQTLNAYSDASINELFTIIYDTVERGLGEKGDSDEDQQQQQQQDDEENMNEMLQQAQELLEEAKQSTQVQFLCFKVHE